MPSEFVSFGFCAVASFLSGYMLGSRSGSAPQPDSGKQLLVSDDSSVDSGPGLVQHMMPSSMPPASAAADPPRRKWPALERAASFWRSFSEPDPEGASRENRRKQLAKLWLFYNWRWLVPLLVAAVAVGYGTLYAVRAEVRAASDAASIAASERTAALERLLSDRAE